MISAITLNSELINKIAQDFAHATSLAVVVVNIHGDEISELFILVILRVACALATLVHPSHIVIYAPGDLLAFRLPATRIILSIILFLICQLMRQHPQNSARSQMSDRQRAVLPW